MPRVWPGPRDNVYEPRASWILKPKSLAGLKAPGLAGEPLDCKDPAAVAGYRLVT